MKFLVAVLVATTTLGCGRTERQEPPLVVAPPAEDDAASIALDTRFDGDHVFVDVLARGIADVHGVAFRVTFDSALLRFSSARTGPSWSKQAMALATEGTPGQLAVLWTELGELTSVDAIPRTVLGTLVFDRADKTHSLEGMTLRFRTDRSRVMDRKGQSVRIAWRDAAVE